MIFSLLKLLLLINEHDVFQFLTFYSLQITKLEASVYSMDVTTSTVTIRENDCEVKTCCLADETGIISLSLWDTQIDFVNVGRAYSFTNLSTRIFNDNITLTTTRTTSITPIHKKIATPTTTDNTQTPPPTLHTITTDVTGASITMKKHCPKCHTAQQALTKNDTFHWCPTCKILRKGTSYITKCSEFLTIEQQNEEISLTITNSLLTKFINQENDINSMDNQDIEEYLMSISPLTISFTDNNYIVDLNKPKPITPDDKHDSDDELTAVIIDIPKESSQIPNIPQENTETPNMPQKNTKTTNIPKENVETPNMQKNKTKKHKAI